MTRLVVGLTGATGAAYTLRLLRRSRELGVETHLIATPAGILNAHHELGLDRSSLEADVTMGQVLAVGDVDFAEVAIVARVTMGEGDGISVRPSEWHKCGRCWRLLPEVTEDGALCGRCDAVVAP